MFKQTAITISLVFVVCIFNLSAQTSPVRAFTSPKYIPPPPEAFAMTRFGNLPIGTFTGTAMYSFPVYTITSGGLSVPITLSYRSNGVKVDEISSRVGMGWTLDVGGVISRAVNDQEDNRSAGILTPGTNDQSSAEFYNFLQLSESADTQPDDYSFSFTGQSGKFFFDKNFAIKQIPYSKLRIQEDGQGFVITDTEGNRNYFDIPELTKTGADCNKDQLGSVYRSAWYLSKIINDKGDSITFHYEITADYPVFYHTGTEQRMHVTNYISDFFASCEQYPCDQTMGLQTCFQSVEIAPVWLKEIRFPLGKAQFYYSGREDLKGDKKLDSMVIYNQQGQLIRKISLEQMYANNTTGTFDSRGDDNISIQTSYPELRKRLFLSKIQATGTNGSSEVTSFEYDSINSLPPRLSFAQDYYGFYNGKVNRYFFPLKTYASDAYTLNGIGADRRVDHRFAKYGMLKKIVYPTGGSSIFEYEANDINAAKSIIEKIDSVSASIIKSTAFNQEASSAPFKAVKTVNIHLSAKCDWSVAPDPFFPEDDYAIIRIVDAADNSIKYENIVLPGNRIDVDFNSPLTTESKVVIITTQPNLDASATVTYTSNTTVLYNQIQLVGGLRVWKITDQDGLGSSSGERIFKYHSWANHNLSSGANIGDINFDHNFIDILRSFKPMTGGGSGALHCMNVQVVSSSTRTLYQSSYNTANYATVIELQGKSNNTNGGIEYNFLLDRDYKAQPLGTKLGCTIWDFTGVPIPGSPNSNTGTLNGMEKSRITFRLLTDSTRQILSRNEQFYSEDKTIGTVDSFYAVRKMRTRDAYVINWRYFNDYDVNRYEIYSKWAHLDSSRNVTFSNTTSDSLVQVTYYQYDTANMQLASSRYNDSKQDLHTVTYKYPHHFKASGNVYEKMWQRNFISPVVEKTEQVKGTETYREKTNYSDTWFPNRQLIAPESIERKNGNNPIEVRLRFQRYSPNGKPLQLLLNGGETISYLWGYNNTYPVAKITGTDYDTVSKFINPEILQNPVSDQQLRTELDKLRNSVKTAMTETFTYLPLIGQSSLTDLSGKIVFYEYDGFGRLKIIRDHDGKILKQFSYQFQQPISQ